MAKLNPAKYRGCSGLPFDTSGWKKAIPYRPGEIDYDQPAKQMIRLTPETAEYLYSEYTPTEAHYEPGTRPRLERVVQAATSPTRTRRDNALSLLEWTCRRVVFTRGVRKDVRVVGGTEEDLIERGFGYCNEASRVFVTLCQVAGIPARMTFHWTTDGRYGHSCAEAWFDGRWVLCDSDINVSGVSVPGAVAGCRELMTDGSLRAAFDRIVTKEMLNLLGLSYPGAKYSDCFHLVGICNYPVESFPYKVRGGSSSGPYL